METLSKTYGSVDYNSRDKFNKSTTEFGKHRNSRNLSMIHPSIEADELEQSLRGFLCWPEEQKNFITILDKEEAKEYFIEEKELLETIDPKMGKNLLTLSKSQNLENSHEKSYYSEEGYGKMNFRLPAFPFCNTCNKNNKIFLQNREFLVFTQEDNTQILFSKNRFLDKLSRGQLILSKDISNPSIIQSAIEAYQIKNGAKRERDVDYNTLKTVSTKHLEDKISQVLMAKKTKSKEV
jgi:hypothetical protein